MAANNMHNLTTLIKRLEAATSRLEDMASATVESPKPNGTLTAAPAAVADGIAMPPSPPAPKAISEPVPALVEGFDTFIANAVQNYVRLSDAIGEPISEQAAKVYHAFTEQRKFLYITTKSKKVDMMSPAYMELLKPLQDDMMSISEIRDKNRASPVFNQLSTISESISVLAWVTVDPKPFKHVEDSQGSAEYWGNRVIKEYKQTDPKQVEWVQSYYRVIKDLAEYVRQTFPQGILWNPRGVSPQEASKLVADAASEGLSKPQPATTLLAASGAPPPPPPPPPGPAPIFEIDEKPAAQAPAAGGLDAVFSELNRGEAVTKGLRKVKPEEMTHKNPSLRAGATVPTRSDSQSSVSPTSRGKNPGPGKKPKPESMRTKKPPRKELDGNKWFIENYDGESQAIDIDVSINHSILISRCNKTTVMVKGKANAVSVENSQRLSLIVESLVSSVDVIKAPNFALQVTGTLPTILMDQVDGAQIYLGKESMNTEIFASKCSGVNLNVVEGEEGDFKEYPLPGQIRTYIDSDGKVVSEIVEHVG